MHVSNGADVSTASSIEQSAMASGRGRGRDFVERCGSFEGRGSYSGKQSDDKGPR